MTKISSAPTATRESIISAWSFEGTRDETATHSPFSRGDTVADRFPGVILSAYILLQYGLDQKNQPVSKIGQYVHAFVS
jgi:hypothetical protein